jgi:hypothetical protein
MAEYEVGGVIYEFPDSFTDEQVKGIMRRQGIIPPARPAPAPAGARARPPQPKVEAKVEAKPTDFSAMVGVQGEPRDFMAEVRGEKPPTLSPVPAAPPVLTMRPAGVPVPVLAEEPAEPQGFYVTRSPAYAERIAEQAAEEAEAAQDKRPDLTYDEILAEQTAKVKKSRELGVVAGGGTLRSDSFFPMFRESRLVNVPTGKGEETIPFIRDDETGELRRATTTEQMSEAFARQPLMSEEEAIVRSVDPQTPYLKGVLSSPIQGRGVYETPLGATLRALPQVMVALGTEAYFGGLGYEVDEQGKAVDPEDFGFKVAKVREGLGVPAVASPLDILLKATQGPAATAVDVQRTMAERAGLLKPQAPTERKPDISGAIPLPGVATRREADRYVGAPIFDPASRRSASVQDTYLQRVTEAVAKGRNLGDEYASSPELVKYVGDAWGVDEGRAKDIAWGLGTVAELAIPVLPPVGRLAGVSTQFAGVLEAAAKAKPGAQVGAASKAIARVAGLPKAATEAAAKVVDPMLALAYLRRTQPDIWAAMGKPMFARSLDDIAADAADAAQGGRVGSGSAATRAWMRVFYEIRRQLTKAVPDEFVLVSDSFAAPKASASELRQAADRAVAGRIAAGADPKDAAKLRDEAFGEFYRGGSTARDVSRTGLTPLADLTTRQLSPTLPGIQKSFLESLPVRYARALSADLTDFGTPPSNALVAKIEDDVKQLSFLAAKEAERLITSGVRASTAATSEARKLDGLDAALRTIPAAERGGSWDRIVKEGMGIQGGLSRRTEVEAELPDILQRLGVRELKDLDLNTANIQRVWEAVQRRVWTGLSAEPLSAHKLAPYVATSVVEEGLKKAISGDAALAELARRQGLSVGGVRGLGLYAPTGRMDLPTKGAAVPKGMSSTTQWKSGVESAFKPQQAFTPEALSGAWSDAIGRAVEDFGQVKKGALTYLASQLGPIPNVPVWLARSVEGAANSVASIGLARTLGAGQDLVRAMTQSQAAVPTAKLFTSNGVDWTRELIQAEAKAQGIGLSGVQARRQNLANFDLAMKMEREALRKLYRGARVALPDYERWAEGLSDRYRLAVFEGGLRRGLLPADSAQYARNALLDYASLPAQTQGTLAYFAGSAADIYGGFTNLGGALLRNPDLIGQQAKIQTALRRKDDPYLLQGDDAARAFGVMGIEDGDYTVLGPRNPMLWPVEGLLAMISGLERGYMRTKDILETGEYVEGATDLVSSAIEMALSLAATTGAEEGTTQVIRSTDFNRLPDQVVFGALMAKGVTDPFYASIVNRVLRPEAVKPPKGFGVNVKGAERVWSALPEDWAKKGIVWTRLTDRERASFDDPELAKSYVHVWKLSPQGKAALIGLRKVTPAIIERYARYKIAEMPQAGSEAGKAGVPTLGSMEAIAAGLVTGGEPLPAGAPVTADVLRQTRMGE